MNGLGLSRSGRAAALLLVQAVLVLSIAAKYLQERRTSPRVWVRAAQYDPNLPLRGRYLALRLAVDACGLPKDEAHHMGAIPTANPPNAGYWQWTVRPVAMDGKLTPMLASDTDQPERTDEVTQWGGRPCDRAVLSKGVEYFVPDTAASPFPPKPGQELWVEVTVPPLGPPQQIQLAVSQGGVFTPLNLR